MRSNFFEIHPSQFMYIRFKNFEKKQWCHCHKFELIDHGAMLVYGRPYGSDSYGRSSDRLFFCQFLIKKIWETFQEKFLGMKKNLKEKVLRKFFRKFFLGSPRRAFRRRRDSPPLATGPVAPLAAPPVATATVAPLHPATGPVASLSAPPRRWPAAPPPSAYAT